MYYSMSSKSTGGGGHDRVEDHVAKRQRFLTDDPASDDKEDTGGDGGNSDDVPSTHAFMPFKWEQFLVAGEDRGCITLVDALPFTVRIALEDEKL